jgi:pimeloyl-ACP methyl ester carboxylesterase
MAETRYTGVADWERLPSRRVPVNGIELSVVAHGEGPLVVLCHGFPELGFSWRHQVFALAAAGCMVWFQEPGAADAVLNADVRRTLLSEDVHAASWMTRDGSALPVRPWQSEDELAVFIRAFERTGFTGGLNYYRNIDRNWALTEYLDGRTIDHPSLFLAGSADLVGRFMSAGKLTSILTDLRGHIVLDGAGHWVQQERPDDVNAALLAFLGSLDGSPARSDI